MANLLFLVHRLPYPPDKGEKARAFHTLKHLAQRHRVLLGTFVDNAEDLEHVGTVKSYCTEVCAVRIHPKMARITSLRGLFSGEALTLPYYANHRLGRWVHQRVRRGDVDVALVYSSCMGQFVDVLGPDRVLVDFVDVDSAKWSAYALQSQWPMSWLYRREATRLLAWERALASRAEHSFFVTEKDSELFRKLAPESARRVSTLCMGVDADFFSPREGLPSPFDAGEVPLVFTGSMDYWPNADAVVWFVREVMPRLRAKHPALRFHIVGRNPTAAVRALASGGVVVTGKVPDVRPYLQHAAVVVAPLRLARGIQTKILEAMAMGRPVVAAEPCVQALGAMPGRDIIAANEPEDYLAAIHGLLSDHAYAMRIGTAGRSRVMANHDWSAHLQVLDRHLERMSPSRDGA